MADDSILEKAHTDANALLGTHYDPSLGHYVKGLNCVSLLYVVGALAVPIAVELVEKTQANYFFCSIPAYISLENLIPRLGIGHFRLKARLYLSGLKAMHYALTKLAA